MNEQPAPSHLPGEGNRSYLERLPAQARREGSAQRGEFQLDLKEAGSAGTGFVYEDEYFAVVVDPVIFPRGRKGFYLRIFEQAALAGGESGVVMLPFYDGRVWLVRHHRHAIREWALELPRGFSDPNKSSEENVRRETRQELGVELATLRQIGEVTPNSGLLASRVGIWYVTLGAAPVATADSVEEGIAEAVPLTPDELKAAVRAGRITDGFTLSAMTLACTQGLLE